MEGKRKLPKVNPERRTKSPYAYMHTNGDRAKQWRRQRRASEAWSLPSSRAALERSAKSGRRRKRCSRSR